MVFVGNVVEMLRVRDDFILLNNKCMAKIKGNHVMKNVRGMFGKQVVFKERLGTPYVAGPPDVNVNRIAKEEEAGNRNRFGEAVQFGKEAMKDADLKKKYAALAKKGQTAYNVAVSDARLPPKINSLLTQGYTGKIGSCILVQATDNVKVMRVHVTIFDAAMALIEQGEAVDNGDNFNWIYAATVLVQSVAGYTVEVRVYDMAANETMKSVVVL
jgi:hypothetical protein